MKRGIILSAVLAAAFFIPTGAQANHSGAECFGKVAKGGTATCRSTFSHASKAFISIVDTHANFHEFQTRGYLTLTWRDAANRIVVSYGCLGNGLPGDGAADQSYAGLCTQYGRSSSNYVLGLQTLEVTAYNNDCPTATCNFHGRLRLPTEGDLF